MVSSTVSPSRRVKSVTTSPESQSVSGQAPPVTIIAPIIPQTRTLNGLKGDGVLTILEKLVLMEDLEGKHPDILKTIWYHEFEYFKRPRSPYIPSWVRQFYTSYEELVPKNKKKESEFIPVRLGRVRGKEMECHNEHINTVLGRPMQSVLLYKGFPTLSSLDEL